MIKGFLKRITGKQEGAALIVSLLVLMVLVLLGLTLILQSQTEYLGAVNENDALAALSFAESGLEWAERKIKDIAAGDPDLDEVLNGPDNVATEDDNLFGIYDQPVNLTLPLISLNSTCPGANCEQTVSVKVNVDWYEDGNPLPFEAFRTGTDLDDDGDWDGPRAILYLRIEDNYDDPANSGIQDLNDEDWRARVRVMVEYPVFVDSAGIQQDPLLATRGVAVRKLEGRLSPAKGIAIRTQKEFDGNGTFKICGACGGVHSNGDMSTTGSSAQVCADATSTGDYSTTGGGPNVQGDSGGGRPEEFIPIINPYDPKFVPKIGTFNHSADGELAFTEPDPATCPGCAGLGTALQCGPPSDTDPGASKYFALVFKKQSGQHLQVYKAYPDFGGTPSRWLWRLIDEGPTLNATLDNCGRLVSSPDLGLAADPCPAGNQGCESGSLVADQGVSDLVDCCGSPWPAAEGGDDAIHCDPNCMNPGLDGLPDTPDDINMCRPDGVIAACDGTTSGDDQFYGFKGGNSYVTDSCATDDSLSGLTDNDYNKNDFYLYGGGNNSDSAVPALPGTLGPADGIPDFDYSVVTAQNRQKWDNDTTTIFSPLYNAVIFGFGNMNFNGDMINGKIQFHDRNPIAPSAPGTYSIANPAGRWRVSVISYGRVEVRGAPRFGPANSNSGDCAGIPADNAACHVGFVAGRDLDLAGGAGTSCDADPTLLECNLCPDWVGTPGADCTVSAVIPFGYEGMFVAHEQVNLSGNSNFAGFVIAEEAAYCVETNSPGLKTRMNGNPDIYYDCEHPPDPWLAERLRINSWEEVQ